MGNEKRAYDPFYGSRADENLGIPQKFDTTRAHPGLEASAVSVMLSEQHWR
jgi:hypothetical protein